MAMFGYMTDTETVEPLDTVEVEAEGKKVLTNLGLMAGKRSTESLPALAS